MINASRLAERRVTCGLSQRKLAYLAGLNYQVIRRLEAGGDDGNVTLRHFARICEALGVPPHDLISASVAMPLPREVTQELSLAQARLLRQVHRGEDVRRDLSGEDRELVLPSLLHRGLVRVDGGAPISLSPEGTRELTP